jgi:hypothetical protein
LAAFSGIPLVIDGKRLKYYFATVRHKHGLFVAASLAVRLFA